MFGHDRSFEMKSLEALILSRYEMTARKITQLIEDCDKSLVEILVRRNTVSLTNEHGVLYCVKETLNNTKL